MSASACEAAIIGAGPYGLAVAAHLLARGIHTHVLGRPMEFWQKKMPRGMFLRSSKRSSSIGSPDSGYSLGDYSERAHTKLADSIRLEDFVAYGHWFQRNAVPDCDHRQVSKLDRVEDGFRLVLQDGHVLHAKCVVVAAGIGAFAYCPEIFSNLPLEKVSHSSDHNDFERFAGTRVVVVGAGQSAFESAALLLESGADVEIVVRGSHVIWLSSRKGVSGTFRSIFDPGTDVGPVGLNQVAARPRLFAALPYQLQTLVTHRCVRPAVAAWLDSRVVRAKLTASAEVKMAAVNGKHVRLSLSDGTNCLVDHLLLATGYKINISNYPFVERRLYDLVSCLNGYPLLSNGFKSSVEGLFFAGAPALLSLARYLGL